MEDEKELNADITYQQYLLHSFLNLQHEATRNGYSDFYEAGLDDLFAGIALEDKTKFIEAWNIANDNGHSKQLSMDEKDKIKRNRVRTKRQIITNIIRDNGWLFREKPGVFSAQIKQMKLQAQGENNGPTP